MNYVTVPNCVEIVQTTAEICQFSLFKMAAVAILTFWNFKFLMARTVKRVKLHMRAKFCQNRSNCGRDMAIFWSKQSSGPNCVSKPNFVKIARNLAEIWLFLKMTAAAILDFRIFNSRDGQEGPAASACQILSKSVKPRLRSGYFSIFFKMATAAMLDL